MKKFLDWLRLFSVQRMRKYEGFFFMPYIYTGKDKRRVTDWMLHLGFFRLIKERIAS